MPEDSGRLHREVDQLRQQLHRELDQLRGDHRNLDQKIESTARLLSDKISERIAELHHRIDEIPKNHVTQKEWSVYRKAIWVMISAGLGALLGYLGLKSGVKLPPP